MMVGIKHNLHIVCSLYLFRGAEHKKKKRTPMNFYWNSVSHQLNVCPKKQQQQHPEF